MMYIKSWQWQGDGSAVAMAMEMAAISTIYVYLYFSLMKDFCIMPVFLPFSFMIYHEWCNVHHLSMTNGMSIYTSMIFIEFWFNQKQNVLVSFDQSLCVFSHISIAFILCIFKKKIHQSNSIVFQFLIMTTESFPFPSS